MNDITQINTMKDAIVWLLANRREETALSDAIKVLQYSLGDSNEAGAILSEIAATPATFGLQGI